MNKKTFDTIAAIIATTRYDHWEVATDALDTLQYSLEGYFTAKFPNFDRDRFNRAARGEK